MAIFYTQPEGLVPASDRNEVSQLILSKNTVEISDLIGEGEISGLVDREYIYQGNLGSIGYESYTEDIFSGPSGANNGFLRSVYLNNVPVISSQNFYNFQNFQIETTNGTPNGAIFQFGSNSQLSITRIINEKFRSTEITYNNEGQPIPSERNNFKVYKILNKNCNIFSLNLKIVALNKTLSTEQNQHQPGSIEAEYFKYTMFYRPVYQSDTRNQKTLWIFALNKTLYGNITYGFIQENIIIPNPVFMTEKDFIGWEVLAIRLTPDSLNRSVQNTVFIDSLTEYTNERFTYPNTAIIKTRFDAEYFNQVPARGYDVRGLKVKIPSTYDPILRNYTEPDWGWDGTFKETKEWTNNPVWCFYDILTNKRYGLGKTIDESLIDKFTLYEISKYCDQLVSDENGNLEPRFTCNLILNTREEAFKVLSDMASIFRAMTYYGFGSIYVSQDAEKEAKLIFTNSNVENANFTYSTSSKKSRHNIAIIRYNDPSDFYKPALEVVEDFDSIRRYGPSEIDLTAFGCTSRSQAIRLGRWILLTENTETETVSFKTSDLASYLQPGDIFGIVDSNRKLQRLCGRTLQIDNYPTGVKIILDSQLNLNTGTIYSLSLIGAKSHYDPSLISDLTSDDYNQIRTPLIYKGSFTGVKATTIDENNKTIVYLPQGFSDFSSDYAPNAVWTIELNNGNTTETHLRTYLNSGTDYYRVLSIEEEESNKFNVSALQYNKDKFLAIDSGIAYQRSAQKIGTIPSTPTNLNLSIIDKLYSKSIDYRFSIPANPTAVSHFKIYAKTGQFNGGFTPGDEFLVNVNNYNNLGGIYTPGSTGNYFFRVYSYNSEGDVYSASAATANIEVPVSPLPIQDVTVSSIILTSHTGAYIDTPIRSVNTTNIDPVFNWQVGFKNPENPLAGGDFTYRITVREPSPNSIPSSNIYYSVTGLSQTGIIPEFSFPFELNNNSALRALGGPFRNYDVVVEAMDQNGNTSAGNNSNPPITENGWMNNLDGFDVLNVNNPAITGFILTSGLNQGNGYVSDQFFTASREGIINFTGNSVNTVFENDILGGFIYISTGYFSGLDAQTGRLDIVRTPCSWDDVTKTAYAPMAIRTTNIPNVNYIGLSLYDIFDDAHKTSTFYTGLYVTPSVPFSGEMFGTSMQLSTQHNDKKFTVRSVINNNNQQELHLIDNATPTLPSILHTFV